MFHSRMFLQPFWIRRRAAGMKRTSPFGMDASASPAIGFMFHEPLSESPRLDDGVASVAVPDGVVMLPRLRELLHSFSRFDHHARASKHRGEAEDSSFTRPPHLPSMRGGRPSSPRASRITASQVVALPGLEVVGVWAGRELEEPVPNPSSTARRR